MTGTRFSFTDARWENQRREATFHYRLITDSEAIDFKESLKFPLEVPLGDTSDNLLKALHLALGMSYYKSLFPPEIDHPYCMSQNEAAFWNTVWRNGFGEFMLVNELVPKRLASFKVQDGVSFKTSEQDKLSEKAMLGIGGGKDSIVAGELLKDIGMQFDGFVLATGEIVGQAKAVADKMGVELLAVERRLDPRLLELNIQPGVLNGHIPISLVFALVGCVLALTKNARYVVVANESSASLPQARWQDLAINHQWSKSIEFEKLFQDYVLESIHPQLRYFSAVRPLNSVAIAKLFSAYPQYFEVFTSDNSVFKIDQSMRDHPRWSLTSSKSLSSYMLMSAWLNEDILLRIFGRNFFTEAKLLELGCRLLGYGKPVLDCVGTPEELRSSMVKAIEIGNVDTESILVREFISKEMLANTQPVDSYLSLGEHCFPDSVQEKLEKEILKKL